MIVQSRNRRLETIPTLLNSTMKRKKSTTWKTTKRLPEDVSGREKAATNRLRPLNRRVPMSKRSSTTATMKKALRKSKTKSPKTSNVHKVIL